MAAEIVQVDKQRVTLALGRLRLGIQSNDELMRILGAAQLRSVYKTFSEEGSPAGSWPALSSNTIRRNPKKYGAGHKLLIDSGRLRNSITFAVSTGSVRIGTNVVYARVHQLGSADRAGAGIGPQARIAGRDISVASYNRLRQRQWGRRKVAGKNGRERTVDAKYQGPLNKDVQVAAHKRHQNIPPRPYLVFRPEDAAYLRQLTRDYIARQIGAVGLEAFQR